MTMVNGVIDIKLDGSVVMALVCPHCATDITIMAPLIIKARGQTADFDIDDESN